MAQRVTRRQLMQEILASPDAGVEQKDSAQRVIDQLDKHAAYMSAYGRRRLLEDADWAKKERRRKAESQKRNIASARAKTRRHHKKLYDTDPKWRTDSKMRSTVHRLLRGNQKRSEYLDCLDWTPALLKAHIEAQFSDGMTWENWGRVWELDHIEPRRNFWFDSHKHPEFIQCWRLANLKPTLRPKNRAQGYERKDE